MLDQATEWARRTFDTFIATEVRLRRDRLVIANPGGLYGINVERLGRDPVTSPRNLQLVEICQHVYSAATGARAVEALASGIPLVTEAQREAGLAPARYFDSGIRFTVMLRQQSQIPLAPAPPPAMAPGLSGRDQLIYDLLAGVPRTASELAAQTRLSAATVRRSLRALRAQGLVRQHGGRGRKPPINGCGPCSTSQIRLRGPTWLVTRRTGTH